MEGLLESVLAVVASLTDEVVQECIDLTVVVVLLPDVRGPQMAGVVVDFEQDSFFGYFLTVPVVGPCQLPVSFDELTQLLHWTAVVVLAPHHVNERVRLLFDVVVGRN